MFDQVRERRPLWWAIPLAAVAVGAAFVATVELREPPATPPPPPPPDFHWDAYGLKLHQYPAVVRCFETRKRSENDDPDEVITIVFGARVQGFDDTAVSVQAGDHGDLERCLTKALSGIRILPKGATEPVGWRVKLATWDRHPV